MTARSLSTLTADISNAALGPSATANHSQRIMIEKSSSAHNTLFGCNLALKFQGCALGRNYDLKLP